MLGNKLLLTTRGRANLRALELMQGDRLLLITTLTAVLVPQSWRL